MSLSTTRASKKKAGAKRMRRKVKMKKRGQ